jgi:putative transposase
MTTLKKGFKYRMYPTQEQQVFLEKTFGSTRFVYNQLLGQAISAYQAFKLDSTLPKPKVSSYDFINQLPTLKSNPDYPWLSEISSVALQESAKNLGKAFTNFFRAKGKSGYPRFKKKSNTRSLTLTTQGFQLEGNQLFLAKAKVPFTVNWSRDLPSPPTSLTITRNPSGHYHASFIADYQPTPTNGQSIIGIDLGIKTLATISTGQQIPNPKYYIQAQYKLTALQRQLSKKLKGSANRAKAILKVAKLHQYISNQRLDTLHKVTSKLISDNQAICIEDLNVKGMSSNRHLAKHVLDGGFGLFRHLLAYKAIASSWCRLLIADRWYPSTQLCSACGQKPLTKIKLGVTKWTCLYCGTIHGRDDNASQNLYNLAMSKLDVWEPSPGHVILLKAYQT